MLMYFSLVLCIIFNLYVRSEPISNFQKPSKLPTYFAIDIDDTFFIEDENMFTKNVEAFKKLKSKGVTPFFCTGRDLSSAKLVIGNNFFNETSYHGFPGVYSDSGIVYDERGDVLKNFKFDETFLDAFKSYIETQKLTNKTLFYTKDGTLCIAELEANVAKFVRDEKMTFPTQTTYEQLKTKDIVSIVFPTTQFEMTGYTKGDHYNEFWPYDEIIHLTPKGCDKIAGFKSMIEHFQKSADDFAYIGDGDNDKECMKYCTLSFAVGNASEEVKQCAKWVVDIDYDKGAFAKVVDLLFPDEDQTQTQTTNLTSA